MCVCGGGGGEQAAAWRVVTSGEPITAGSVGGRGTGSRRHTQGGWSESQRGREIKHTHTRTHTCKQSHTVHTGSWPEAAAIIGSEAGRQVK